MDVNAAIIDQRVSSLVEELRDRARDELGTSNDGPKLKSLAFTFLALRTLLDLDFDEAFDCLVEGGNDFGVDAIHVTEEFDGEFSVTLLQSKYTKRLDGMAGFPAGGIEKLVQAVRHLFDPQSELENINERLRVRIEHVRSMIRDGFIPQVRIVACSNGRSWEANGEEVIRLARLGDQVGWEHVNHDALVRIMQASRPVNDRLQLTGKALVEDMNFSRVLVGRLSVEEVHALVERHGERLGLHGNRVNLGIEATLRGTERSNFYFYNNGITLTCDKFTYNALQSGDYLVNIENLQIINGGQTCMTIFRTLGGAQQQLPYEAGSPASVLVRLYQLPSDNEELVQRITYATNSQNPVELRDLKANDDRQRRLELDIEQLGFHYRRKRTEQATRPTDITSGSAAEAVLAIWRHRPHQAKFFRREHFGRLYDDIFDDALTGAEVILAILLYRIAENRRRRPATGDPSLVRYGSAFIAMQMGRRLQADLGSLAITHERFEVARRLIEEHGDSYFDASVDDVRKALEALYGIRALSLQQLSATFRRGDLIERIAAIPLAGSSGPR